MEYSEESQPTDRQVLEAIAQKSGLVLTNCMIGGTGEAETIAMLLDSIAENVLSIQDRFTRQKAVRQVAVLLKLVEDHSFIEIYDMVGFKCDPDNGVLAFHDPQLN